MKKVYTVALTALLLAGCSEKGEKPADLDAPEKVTTEAVTTEVVTTEEAVTTEQAQTKVSVEKAQELIEHMHDFNTKDYRFYDALVKEMKANGITPAADYSKPYKEVFTDEYHPMDIRVGVVDDVKVTGADTKKPKFTLTTRTVTFRINSMPELDAQIRKIEANLASNPVFRDAGLIEKVTYELDISKDGKSAVLKRTSDWNWNTMDDKGAE